MSIRGNELRDGALGVPVSFRADRGLHVGGVLMRAVRGALLATETRPSSRSTVFGVPPPADCSWC